MQREHAWQVNADQGARQLHERVRVLEAALRPFVAAPLGYQSGVDRGARWCAPKVRHEDMNRARAALDRHSEQQGDTAHNPADSPPISRTERRP